jgi:hypothetical protein
VPTELIVSKYFSAGKDALDKLNAEREGVIPEQSELEEEHGGEDGAFSELDRINKANVTARLKELKKDKEAAEETVKAIIFWGERYLLRVIYKDEVSCVELKHKKIQLQVRTEAIVQKRELQNVVYYARKTFATFSESSAFTKGLPIKSITPSSRMRWASPSKL